jgi:2-iminobutanoate/2-iminopropanoate deaminase
MPKRIVHTDRAPVTGFTDKNTPSPLAQAIRVGDFLFVSGQGPLDPKTKEVVSSDVREQTRQILSNLAAILEAGGASVASIINMRVCLRNVADFSAFNEVFREFMGGEKVTRTCTGGTPHRAGVLVEIDCIAYLA